MSGDDEGPGKRRDSSQSAAVVWVSLRGQTHRLDLAAGETIFAGLHRSDLDPPFSCLAGYCAECAATLEQGEVEMKVDKGLTQKQRARGLILTCQSVPRTDVCRIRFAD
jgi:ferredoxin